VGIWDYPQGHDYYDLLVKYYTSTDMTPAQIHRLGLKEVARIRAEMKQIIDETGFVGSFEGFLDHLREDPRFYFESQGELMNAYLLTCKRIDPELPRLFGRLPRTPYGVRAVPDAVAPDTVTAYYQPPAADGSRAGFFYVNLFDLRSRPRYEVEVLTAHEAVPGHHLQMALAQELSELPAFRRNSYLTAFVEGWALYSESLGGELGLYKDPYSRFGRLTYDMWRAVRLVVDTGIHHFKWGRQRAIDYFRDHAARPERDIANEIDRYISWPGQALAYKIGQLKILQLRQRAEQQLGGQFDVRAFHDAVLARGPVTLDMLEQQVTAFIAGVATSNP
jgi:prolyl oligopeptidase